MTKTGTRLAEARTFYARLLAAGTAAPNPRLERAFESIPREAFLPPGPWHIFSPRGRRYVETPSADPIHLYQNVLVALDVEKRINNGEPQLHAAWIAAADPQPGDAVCHIGAGTGYYSALLSFMIAPGGTLVGYEIEKGLAAAAVDYLKPFEGVTVIDGDATVAAIPPSDIIYVNAGVVAPPAGWLAALKIGGRMIFPWRPSEEIAMAVLATRTAQGIAVRPFGSAFFIPCIGASSLNGCEKAPDRTEAQSIRSLWRKSDRAPDASAVAIYPEIWFSSEAVAAAA